MSDKKRILVLSSLYHYTHLSQMIEYLSAYKKYSKHNYYYHNFVYDFDPETLDLDQFDVVMIAHNFWPLNLTPSQKSVLAKTKALKVLFLQDEYQFVRPINAVMNELGIDLMFTCVAEKDFDIFYPKSLIKSLKGVYGVLTGYVSDQLSAPGVFQLGNKKFDVGFRSRVSPFFLGTIGHEKFRISDKFGTFAAQAGLRTNISINEEDRIFGTAWIEFLKSCRTQLGTPSGSSVIDFNGKLLKKVASYRRAFPRAKYEKVFEKLLAPHDGKYEIDTVSPRTFECAATGTAMVHLSGFYGGLLEPGRHYIELKSDYSNMAEVVEQIRDKSLCQSIAQYAYDDLIKSGQYHFRTFVEKFDVILEKHLPSTHYSSREFDENKFYKYLVEKHDQSFTLSESGLSYFDTEKARYLIAQDKTNNALRRAPVLRGMLQRIGGEPHRKVRKGKVALRIAATQPAFRSLLVRSLFRNKNTPKIEQILKDILLLSIIKASQSGLNYSGGNFRTRLKMESHNIILMGESMDVQSTVDDLKSKNEDNSLSSITKNLHASPASTESKIVVDLMKVFPLTDFASSIIFSWPFDGEMDAIRSAPDLFFHMPGLSLLQFQHPKTVAQAILCALTPANEDERRQLKRFFNGEAS